LEWVKSRNGELPRKSSIGINRVKPIDIDFSETINWHD
jgi:hypothetical protein